MLTKKSLAIVKSGSGERVNIMIEPGVLVGDVRRELGLGNYVLSKPDSNKVFADGQALYPIIEDGEQLVATQEAKVGSLGPTLIIVAAASVVCVELLKRAIKGKRRINREPDTIGFASTAITTPRSTPHVTTAQTVPKSQIVRAGVTRIPEPSLTLPQNIIRVKPDSRPVWQRKGWKRNGDSYDGFYRIESGSWLGRAVERWKGHVDFFILNPPPRVLYGPHRACFKGYNNGLFWIHLYPSPADVASGIMAVERVLQESL